MAPLSRVVDDVEVVNHMLRCHPDLVLRWWQWQRFLDQPVHIYIVVFCLVVNIKDPQCPLFDLLLSPTSQDCQSLQFRVVEAVQPKGQGLLQKEGPTHINFFVVIYACF